MILYLMVQGLESCVVSCRLLLGVVDVVGVVAAVSGESSVFGRKNKQAETA